MIRILIIDCMELLPSRRTESSVFCFRGTFLGKYSLIAFTQYMGISTRIHLPRVPYTILKIPCTPLDVYALLRKSPFLEHQRCSRYPPSFFQLGMVWGYTYHSNLRNAWQSPIRHHLSGKQYWRPKYSTFRCFPYSATVQHNFAENSNLV